MNKSDLMELTGLDHGVDAALPQAWLDAMAQKMQLDYDKVRLWYVWQYQKSPSGPVHLGEELLEKMTDTTITVDDMIFTIAELVELLLKHPDLVEIRVKRGK